MEIYLKHDIHCLDDPEFKKLVREFHAFGYAVFFRCLESMYLNNGNPVSKDDLVMDVSEGLRETETDKIEECINKAVEIGLFLEKDGKIFSKRVQVNFQELQNLVNNRSIAGKKSGEARRSKTNKNEQVLNKCSNSVEQMLNYEEEDEDEDKDKEEDSKKEIIKKKNTFTPPNIEEIKTYFKEKGSTESEAESFYNFYESKGWYVGKNKMQKWHSAASGWIGRNVNGSKTRTSTTRFRPRDLSGSYQDPKDYYVEEF